MASQSRSFETIRTEGGLLPADFLARLAEQKDVPGLETGSYHLDSGDRLRDAINRSWTRVSASWKTFSAGRDKTPDADPGTTITRSRWLLVLFDELGYGRLPSSKPLEVAGKSYPISHIWQHTPIHLVGFRVDLDRRSTGVAGAARTSPHSLVQEFLNRSEGHLWAIVSNGLRLRLLRDSASLTRMAYVEFDLEAMMNGGQVADFAVLWLLLHESRVEAESPKDCWLERWATEVREQGRRALDGLRDGVEHAIETLGAGFMSHPANLALRDRLRSGELTTLDYYRQVLRFVYRLIFLFVAEDRNALLPGSAGEEVRRLYDQFYSTARLRRIASRRRGTAHADLHSGLRVVMDALGRDDGCPSLGLPALGSFLWSAAAILDLRTSELANRDLLESIRALTYIERDKLTSAVDWKNLGSEELGSVYESLLELHPRIDQAAGTFELAGASGSERKTTGSYYTPESLIRCLLDSALDPVLNEAAGRSNPEDAILALRVCDPACGSGHFLISAAHRVARRLARVRTGDDEPSPEATRTALRDVVGQCLYGVDLNEMAVELCKISLWMEALEPGKPLSFLDHRVLCGNSLLGATPNGVLAGVPDAAFEPLEGDDREIAAGLRKRNGREREGQTGLLWAAEVQPPYGSLSDSWHRVNEIPDNDVKQIRKKEELYTRLVASSDYARARLAADAWCAAILQAKVGAATHAVTQDTLRHCAKDPAGVPAVVREDIARVSRQYRVFHWHLAFPDVFAGSTDAKAGSGWSGGFDAVVGNPPWERMKIQSAEWADETGGELEKATVRMARETGFLRRCGRFGLSAVGDFNSYALFVDLAGDLISPTGRFGLIVPTGIATDDGTKLLFGRYFFAHRIDSLFDFENKSWFPAVHRSQRFCLMTVTGPQRRGEGRYVFFAHGLQELTSPDRIVHLTAEVVRAINPNTETCPVFVSKRDLDIAVAAYGRNPILRSLREGREESPIGFRATRMFDANKQHGLFRSRSTLEGQGGTLRRGRFEVDGTVYLPLFDGKTIDAFDHRYAVPVVGGGRIRTGGARPVSVREHEDPHYSPPRTNYVEERIVREWAGVRLSGGWVLCYMDVTGSTNERSVVSAILPSAATDYSLRIAVFDHHDPKVAGCLCAVLNSFACDYLVRQKLQGLHLSDYLMYQIPVPPLHALRAFTQFLVERVLELSFTAWDLEEWARACGYGGAPFQWDEDRRANLRAEIDAAVFRLYGFHRTEVEHVLSTFPLLRKREEARYSEFRSKRLVLEAAEALA